jgi:non-heme chloroperoxidase
MPYVTVGEGNSGSIDLYFVDHGSGPPTVLIAASSAAAVECSATWETDFRADLRKIDVPVLEVQGDADQAVPFEKTGKRVPAYVSDVQLVILSGGPHATPWTYAEQVNSGLLRFIGAHAAAPAR